MVIRLRVVTDANTSETEIEVNEELRLSSLVLLVTSHWDMSGSLCDFTITANGKEIAADDDSTLKELSIKDGDQLILEKKKSNNLLRPIVPQETVRNELQIDCSSSSGKCQTLEQRLQRAASAFPECFTKIPLLYLRCSLNGREVLALVDTGAQTSIISFDAVKKCDMIDAVDGRFRVEANGVGGTRSSLGRIFAGDVLISGMNIVCSFDVLPTDVQDADIIIGLDVLTKNQAVINISERTIRFENLGSATFIRAEEADKLKPFSETPNCERV
ncbi:Peptidase A2 domain-containing protein [Trichostrongylus colubriformis]|uniref:Peptidase A2 domain-containing protein n=1 Tax=Trichostrongylus colubriformis TaxID=6319 RepID=A0AAN8FIZ3_TRICO